MTVRKAFVFAMLAAALVLSASAFASTGTVSPSAQAATSIASTPAVPSTATAAKQPAKSRNAATTFDLTWTLPTAGKSGCTVCHSDKDLVRVQGGKTVSLFVNTEILSASAHKGIPCTGCHIDFAYKTPHSSITRKGNAWREVAKAACKDCHAQSYTDYTSSAHSPSGLPGESTGTIGAANSSAPGMPKPMCGDCHGGHSIPTSNNADAKRAVHLSGVEMCGKCHAKGTSSYADYYHGRAYKAGAPDAPACWDCHSTHGVLASTNRQSTVHEDRIIDTCKKCHTDPRDGYVSYGQLVHGKQDILNANPVYSAVKSAQGAASSALGRFKSLF